MGKGKSSNDGLKTLKISENVHVKLKVYVASDRTENMTEFGDAAILERLSRKIKEKKK